MCCMSARHKGKQVRLSMSEALRRARIRLLILALFEIVVIATAITLYFFDYPIGFQTIMETV